MVSIFTHWEEFKTIDLKPFSDSYESTARLSYACFLLLGRRRKALKKKNSMPFSGVSMHRLQGAPCHLFSGGIDSKMPGTTA